MKKVILVWFWRSWFGLAAFLGIGWLVWVELNWLL
jgi:hypothetical protein